MPKAIGTRPKWIVLADTDKMNNSLTIWRPNIYITLCIKQFNSALNAFVDTGQQKRANRMNLANISTGVLVYMQLTGQQYCMQKVTFYQGCQFFNGSQGSIISHLITSKSTLKLQFHFCHTFWCNGLWPIECFDFFFLISFPICLSSLNTWWCCFG